MQYLDWADIQIPLCLVTGFSYAKRARTVNHARNFASARGFEASEISVRVTLNRGVAMAYGLEFGHYVELLESFDASKENPQGTVTIGGYPIYPELNFALTNINRTYQTDLATDEVTVLESDITLSGVSCVKEVSRERVLIMGYEDTIIQLPKTTISCKGKDFVIQDSAAVSQFVTTPKTLQLEVMIGQDNRTPERDGFLNDIISEYATVTCELPQGTVIYNVIQAMILDSVLYLTGSILPEAASQMVTKTYMDCGLSDILGDICNSIGVDADIKVDGHVDYYLMQCTPIHAIEELQRSAGFLVSIQGNKLTFAWVPDSVDPQITLDDLSVDDDTRSEDVNGLVWRDGIHEIMAGDVSGEVPKVDSAFKTEAGDGFAAHVLAYLRYQAARVVVSGSIVDTIGSHSQIAVPKDDVELALLVDEPTFDWLAGQMSLECREIR